MSLTLKTKIKTNHFSSGLDKNDEENNVQVDFVMEGTDRPESATIELSVKNYEGRDTITYSFPLIYPKPFKLPNVISDQSIKEIASTSYYSISANYLKKNRACS